ncbi:metallophosphoesterase [Cryptosporangium phraense]|uniref:Phosphodiesterase n=1 Tax=Cryptosporangium phraense TaxID=2593070 RepID=A0A545AI23_9ACTN|nr:metallophosphoesterase [Cryptosporangium phraense]TQS40968.1 phosphodiesterase [Cryptosporangium phraense]
MTLIAHVSDLHFDGGPRAARRAGAVFDYLDRLRRPVDAILVTGDIADHGEPAEYEEAAKLFAGRDRLLHCPGNHDRRPAYRAVLHGDPSGSDEPINRLHHVGGTALLLCDSSIPGRSEGRLADETLAWITATLSDLPDDVPALVAFHHPPVVVHQPYLDAIKLGDERRLATVLADFPQVRAVLTGHAHTAAASTFAGRPLLIAPGVVSTLLLPWESDQVMDLDLPPSIAFHVLSDDGRLTTHYRIVVP